MASSGYVGRFAPSPTGPLHAGSLLCAAASYLAARQAGGRWLLRIEDIDPPREMPGATDDIIRTLARLGFEWDGEIRYQSQRIEHYRERLAQLPDVTFGCRCSRADIRRDAAASGITDGRYPGTCRERPVEEGLVIRARFDAPQPFEDAIAGTFSPPAVADDFLLRRRDGLPAYQWAVAVDDIEQGVTDIVRGNDLLATTPRQIFVHKQLRAKVPAFAHVPVLVNERGQKLSKQHGAEALPPGRETALLCAAFEALGLPVCDAPKADSTRDLWLWAIRHWDAKRLIGMDTIPFVSLP